MDKPNTIKEVDFIFFLLKEEQNYLTVDQFVVRSLTKGAYLKNEKIIIILDFLQEEKLIDRAMMPLGGYHYRINVKGLLFNGYEERDRTNDAKNIRLDAVEAYQHEQADTLNRLTRLVAWGTVAASVIAFLLLVWETRHVVLKIAHYFFG